MDTRTRSETVVFRHSFKLSGADDVQAAGHYVVETAEERLQTSLFPAYRRLSTFIRLPGRSGSMELARIIDIDLAELSAVLARDIEVQETPSLAAQHNSVAVQDEPHRKALGGGWKHFPGCSATKVAWTALLLGGAVLAGLFTWSIAIGSVPP